MPSKKLVQQGVERREQIMAFIERHVKDHGYAPTIEEIGKEVGIGSHFAVRGHLRRLEEEGRIQMTPRIARSIVVRRPTADR